ncbi:MAG: S-methyl-5-thioribose-1-phosphate isomerase [Thermoanaerobaculia bacterium]|nr:S-methyl-5-thioribose-1-phosphate isomerase [Thermoanaerobaculia bacterium]
MPGTDEIFSPIRWQDGLQLLDQTLLPREERWIDCATPEIVADAIYRLCVRGAPAIGVAAAYGLVVGLRSAPDDDPRQRFDEVYDLLMATRPTAVNLRWALEQGREVFEATIGEGREAASAALLELARRIHREDIEANVRMGEHGAELFAPGDRALTHCNAGGLATGGYGTAVGVLTSSFRHGRLAHVWVDETRPLLQGARLTSWELQRLEIPFRLVTDNSVGALMARGLVDRVVVGSDRIAANGDAANKIGTYTVAVLADRHRVPFYVAAPLSTIDLRTPAGADIPIEERAGDEVTEVFGTEVAPKGAPAHNIAFDVTPNELIAAIITEMGVLLPPYTESIADAFERQKRERGS